MSNHFTTMKKLRSLVVESMTFPFTSSRCIAPSVLIVLASLLLGGCKEKDPGRHGDVPPGATPKSSAVQATSSTANTSPSSAGPCASGPGKNTDVVSASYFTGSLSGFCIDPASEIRTYGEKGKYTMDEVCTTAFDGECEVYKRFQLKRVVRVNYIDEAGKGANVEIVLSEFSNVDGAYGMFTKRVVADQDPAAPDFIKPVSTLANAAIGSGRAYLFKGTHLAELQYVSEVESPEKQTRTASKLLPIVMEDLAKHLPGVDALPKAAAILPAANRLPNGIQYVLKEPLHLGGVGAAAIGYYAEGAKRYRVLSVAKDSENEAKEAFKAIRTRAGATAGSDKTLGDESTTLFIEDGKDRPRCEYVVVRKGARIVGVGDEDYVLKTNLPLDAQGAARLTREEKVARIRSSL